MTVPYASVDDARQVTTALKRVAREIGAPEPLHLVDYLEVSPDAPFLIWQQRFASKDRDARHAPEGEADERIKLCTRLATVFVTEDRWRAMMNRLGRTEVEGPVAMLSRRSVSGAALLEHYGMYVHQLSEFYGTPDAAAVVTDLFAEAGLDLPDPATPEPDPPWTDPRTPERPDPRDIPDIGSILFRDLDSGGDRADTRTDTRGEIDHGAPDAHRAPETEQPPPDQTIGGALGDLLLRSLAGWADRKMDEQQRLRDMTPDVSGLWLAPDGSSCTFTQNGSNIGMTGISVGGTVQGRGHIHGPTIQIDGFSQVVGPFRIMLRVSPDGDRMQGQALDRRGTPTEVILERC